MNKFGASRIAQFIAAAGVCSRRQAEKIIYQGRVRIDGQTISTPAITVTSKSIVEIDKKIISLIEQKRLWLYYKPVGLITTHYDPQNRPTVFAALKPYLPRVISVGRLDLNSEGLLLLTNSGSLAQKLESPKNNFVRIYKVRAHGQVENLIIYIIHNKSRPLTIDNITYTPRSIRLISAGVTNSWFEVILTEGKNREIRKIFAYFSLKVNRLIRVKYGKYDLGHLKPGELKEVKV